MAVKFDLALTLSSGHSRALCDKIVDWVGNDKVRFAALMEIFFSGNYRLTQRAAWPMSYCVRSYPELIKPYWKKMMAQIENEEAHPAARRNILRLLQQVPIPRSRQGPLMSLCFKYISSPERPAADKAFSLTILQNLSTIYPEILPELKSVIEERWDQETPAFLVRARKILNKK